MNCREPTPAEVAALTALMNGIIPADATDGGAAMVQAGALAADKMRKGINAAVYAEGLKRAEAIARERFDRAVDRLDPPQIHELLGILRDSSSPFFKQLRLDACASYMSNPRVWEQIGFPGPSTDQGGYPDFDQPQAGRD